MVRPDLKITHLKWQCMKDFNYGFTNICCNPTEHLTRVSSSSLSDSFFSSPLGMSDTSPPMPSLVGTWQAQWKAAGKTVLKNEVNNLSEHLGPCPSFISASPLPIFFISPPSLSFALHPHIRQEEIFFFSFVFFWKKAYPGTVLFFLLCILSNPHSLSLLVYVLLNNYFEWEKGIGKK